MDVMRSLPEIPQEILLIEMLDLMSSRSGRHPKAVKGVITLRLHLIHVYLIFFEILYKTIFISSDIKLLEDVHSRIVLSN